MAGAPDSDAVRRPRLAMGARAYDRIAAGVSIALLAALGLFTFYLAATAERSRGSGPARTLAAHEPDYFVDRLALLTMNERGEPAYRIEARSLAHFPADDSAQFDSPLMVSLHPGQPRVTVTARHGTLFNHVGKQAQEVELRGEVRLTREPRPGTTAWLVAETEQAIVLPDSDIVRTDQAVRLLNGPHELHGVGFELDNRARILRLDSQVRAVMQPPGTPDPPAPAFRSATTTR
jgi:LPS export ABC transporter protein LptC